VLGAGRGQEPPRREVRLEGSIPVPFGAGTFSPRAGHAPVSLFLSAVYVRPVPTSEPSSWVGWATDDAPVTLQTPPGVAFTRVEGLSDTYLTWDGPGGAVFSILATDRPLAPGELAEGERGRGVDVQVIRDEVCRDDAGARCVELRLARDQPWEFRATPDGGMIDAPPEHVVEIASHRYWCQAHGGIRVGYRVREDASSDLKAMLQAMLESARLSS